MGFGVKNVGGGGGGKGVQPLGGGLEHSYYEDGSRSGGPLDTSQSSAVERAQFKKFMQEKHILTNEQVALKQAGMKKYLQNNNKSNGVKSKENGLIIDTDANKAS